jgi:hypothetical protein
MEKLDRINSVEIKYITFLKGDSAIRLYGKDVSNGVIIVEFKE